MEHSMCSDENMIARQKQANLARSKPSQVSFKQRIIEEEAAEVLG